MKCLSSRIEFWRAEAPRLIEKQLLPPELPEHVATRILAELLRVHSQKLEGADVDFCLREAYDVYARAAVDDGQDLSDEVLRTCIPAWVVDWAVAKEWVRRPADLPPDWYQNLTQRLQGRMVHWQAEALTLREKQDRQSRVHETWEALKEMGSLLDGRHEEIPEAFLRNIIAEQYGITAAEVTWDQILLEAERLCQSGGYRAVEIVPTAESPDEDQERFIYTLATDTRKHLHDYLLASLAAERLVPEEANAHTRPLATSDQLRLSSTRRQFPRKIVAQIRLKPESNRCECPRPRAGSIRATSTYSARAENSRRS